MKINTKAALMTPKGDTYKNNNEDLTLGEAIGAVLVIQKTANPWKQFKLAKALDNGDETIDVEAEDVVFLKKALEDNAKGDAPAFYPFILGQCIDMLEGVKEEPKKPAEKTQPAK